MANDLLEISRDMALDRAIADCTRKVVYKLGKGGFNCEDDYADQSGFCDCSGAVAHMIGSDRQTDKIPGGWIETSRVFADATTTRRMFVKVPFPRVGDVCVYPDRGSRQGHIGFITAVDASGKASKVAHCTARSGLPSAMVNEAWSVWWAANFVPKGAIFASPIFYQEDEDLERSWIIVEGVKSEGWYDPTESLNYPVFAALKPILDKEGYSYRWDGKTMTLTVEKKP